jgi:GAF domain-containing protein
MDVQRFERVMKIVASACTSRKTRSDRCEGQRFPMQQCVSGWVMAHGVPAIIADIYDDPRVPIDAFRPTFVRSMAMVPIVDEGQPVGAIGAYWATLHEPTPSQIDYLITLADSALLQITATASSIEP